MDTVSKVKAIHLGEEKFDLKPLLPCSDTCFRERLREKNLKENQPGRRDLKAWKSNSSRRWNTCKTDEGHQPRKAII